VRPRLSCRTMAIVGVLLKSRSDRRLPGHPPTSLSLRRVLFSINHCHRVAGCSRRRGVTSSPPSIVRRLKIYHAINLPRDGKQVIYTVRWGVAVWLAAGVVRAERTSPAETRLTNDFDDFTAQFPASTSWFLSVTAIHSSTWSQFDRCHTGGAAVTDTLMSADVQRWATGDSSDWQRWWSSEALKHVLGPSGTLQVVLHRRFTSAPDASFVYIHLYFTTKW